MCIYTYICVYVYIYIYYIYTCIILYTNVHMYTYIYICKGIATNCILWIILPTVVKTQCFPVTVFRVIQHSTIYQSNQIYPSSGLSQIKHHHGMWTPVEELYIRSPSCYKYPPTSHLLAWCWLTLLYNNQRNHWHYQLSYATFKQETALYALGVDKIVGVVGLRTLHPSAYLQNINTGSRHICTREPTGSFNTKIGNRN